MNPGLHGIISHLLVASTMWRHSVILPTGNSGSTYLSAECNGPMLWGPARASQTQGRGLAPKSPNVHWLVCSIIINSKVIPGKVMYLKPCTPSTWDILMSHHGHPRMPRVIVGMNCHINGLAVTNPDPESRHHAVVAGCVIPTMHISSFGPDGNMVHANSVLASHLISQPPFGAMLQPLGISQPRAGFSHGNLRAVMTGLNKWQKKVERHPFHLEIITYIKGIHSSFKFFMCLVVTPSHVPKSLVSSSILIDRCLE